MDPWLHPATHTVPADEFFRKYELEKKLLLKACQRGNFDFGGCTKPKPKWWEVKLYYHSFMVLS